MAFILTELLAEQGILFTSQRDLIRVGVEFYSKKDLFCRNMSRFTLGLLLYKSDKTVDGKAKMESSIRLFDELGLPEMRLIIKKYLMNL